MNRDLKFGFDYWLAELIDLGRQIEPHKYDAKYINYMKERWREVPLTMLHGAVSKRRREILQPNK